MAFLQPLPPRQPLFRVPAVVLCLIGLFVAVHVLRSMLGPIEDADWISRLAFIPALYSPAFVAAQGWQPIGLWAHVIPFVGYMALHNDLTHLAVNSLWLLAFGPVVARRFGTGLFLLFFLVCGVAAAATHLALNWGSTMPVIGASGAISGLMAAGLRLLPTMRPGAGETALMPLLSRQFLLFSLVWVGMNIVVGVTGIGLGGETGLIAWQAHLGGFGAGVLLTGPFDRLRPQPVGVALD